MGWELVTLESVGVPRRPPGGRSGRAGERWRSVGGGLMAQRRQGSGMGAARVSEPACTASKCAELAPTARRCAAMSRVWAGHGFWRTVTDTLLLGSFHRPSTMLNTA